MVDFNPLPPHGGRPLFRFFVRSRKVISIHSLHTEGDYLRLQRESVHRHFNPLPPHGGRPLDLSICFSPFSFQSTPSTRRETSFGEICAFRSSFQSTPSTRRETRLIRYPFSRIHAFQSTPSTRRETPSCYHQRWHKAFQSTPSTRRETSIWFTSFFNLQNFNPLPPHGGRQRERRNTPQKRQISIHSLHTEGDALCCSGLPFYGISIHSLHTEGDHYA